MGFPKLKVQRGMSLVGVLIAAIVGVGVIMALMSGMKGVLKTGVMVKEDTSFDTIRLNVKHILKRKSLCDDAFLTSTADKITFDPSNSPVSINQISIAGNTLIQEGQIVSGLTIDTIEFEDLGASDTIEIAGITYNRNVVKLNIKASLATGGSAEFEPSPILSILTNDSSKQMEQCFIEAIDGSATSSGIVTAFAMNTPPPGWLLCNGSEVSRTSYANLFAVIGTTYGPGDGSSTFNLPDYRGYFLRGMGGVDPDAATRTIGSVQSDSFKSHRHNIGIALSATGDFPYIQAMNKTDSQMKGSGRQATGESDFEKGTADPWNPASSTGNTPAGDTRPINKSVIYCIKY